MISRSASGSFPPNAPFAIRTTSAGPRVHSPAVMLTSARAVAGAWPVLGAFLLQTYFQPNAPRAVCPSAERQSRTVGWSDVPAWVVVRGDVLVAIGFSIVGRVSGENTYTAATVEVAAGRRLSCATTRPRSICRRSDA